MSDLQIIRQVLGGEINAFEDIMKKYNEQFYRIAISYLKDPMDTEDAMQLAYLKIFENLEKFQGKAAFSTWAIRILINECQILLRKRRNALAFLSRISESIKKQISVPSSDVLLMNKELKRFLEASILELPRKYRTVFMLREIQGLSVRETAQALDLSEANVKVRLHRSKDLLRSKIMGENERHILFDYHLRRCTPFRKRVMELILATQIG